MSETNTSQPSQAEGPAFGQEAFDTAYAAAGSMLEAHGHPAPGDETEQARVAELRLPNSSQQPVQRVTVRTVPERPGTLSVDTQYRGLPHTTYHLGRSEEGAPSVVVSDEGGQGPRAGLDELNRDLQLASSTGRPAQPGEVGKRTFGERGLRGLGYLGIGEFNVRNIAKRH